MVLPTSCGPAGPMDIGCNSVMEVVWAIFNQGDWLHYRCIEDAS
jgi:hypothetical protein